MFDYDSGYEQGFLYGAEDAEAGRKNKANKRAKKVAKKLSSDYDRTEWKRGFEDGYNEAYCTDSRAVA